jgi:putative inorganic carbon (hco3(-)) transporter
VTRRAPAWAFWLLATILFALPWPLGANRDWIWPWFATAFGTLAALVFGGAAAGRWTLSPAFARARVVVALAVGWFALTVLVAWWPGEGGPLDRAAASDAALLTGMHIAVLLLTLALVDSTRRLRRLVAVLFAAGAAQAIYGSFMTLSGLELGFLAHKTINVGLATGTYVNRNHLAGLLAMTGGIGAGLLVAQLGGSRAESWRARARDLVALLLGPKAILRALLAALVVGLVLTQSRMGNVAFFVGLGVAGICAMVAMRPLPRTLALFLVSVVVIDLVVLGSWVGVERVATRLKETTIEAPATPGATSDAERVDVARATLAMWRDRPLLGVGPGGFRTAFPGYKPVSVQLFYDHAHNDWAQLLAERGIVGAVAWVLLPISGFACAVRAMRRRRDPALRGAAFASIAALVALAVHGLADFNLQIPANAAFFHAAIAVGILADRLPARSSASRRRGETLSDSEPPVG